MRLLRKLMRRLLAVGLLAAAVAVAAVATRNGSDVGTGARWVMLVLVVASAWVAFPAPKDVPQAGTGQQVRSHL